MVGLGGSDLIIVGLGGSDLIIVEIEGSALMIVGLGGSALMIVGLEGFCLIINGWGWSDLPVMMVGLGCSCLMKFWALIMLGPCEVD